MVCIYTTGELSIAFFDLFISARPRAEAFAFPVAFSLDIFGDRWTLLVIRDLFYGRTRFKEFAGSLIMTRGMRSLPAWPKPPGIAPSR